MLGCCLQEIPGEGSGWVVIARMLYDRPGKQAGSAQGKGLAAADHGSRITGPYDGNGIEFSPILLQC